MEKKLNEIEINGVQYVRKDIANQNVKAESYEGYDYCIVRTYSAGVFAGYLKSKQGKECEVIKARRLWSWSGAASLSQLAMEGTSNPKNCKFPCEVNSVILLEVIEIIICTEKAKKSIAEVDIWKM